MTPVNAGVLYLISLAMPCYQTRKYLEVSDWANGKGHFYDLAGIFSIFHT